MSFRISTPINKESKRRENPHGVSHQPHGRKCGAKYHKLLKENNRRSSPNNHVENTSQILDRRRIHIAEAEGDRFVVAIASRRGKNSCLSSPRPKERRSMGNGYVANPKLQEQIRRIWSRENGSFFSVWFAWRYPQSPGLPFGERSKDEKGRTFLSF